MALIGLLHVNIMRSTTETQIYFAANDTEDLGDLQIFHSHHYFYREAKRVLVPDCQFSEDGKSLMKGSEVLYSGKDPFVVASVSDEELRYVFDPERCQNPQFLELLANDAVRERLISEVYNDENLSDDEKKSTPTCDRKNCSLWG